MSRLTVFLGVIAILVGMSVPAASQGIPECYPACYPPTKNCNNQQPARPITRTVQVDVPVPCCPPMGCAPVTGCPAPCGPMPCPPACPTQPGNVKGDVRIRPESACAQPPQNNECWDPGPLGPVIGLLAATMAAPIQALDTLFPGPARFRRPCGPAGPGCPPPYPPQCGPCPVVPASLVYPNCVPQVPCGGFRGVAVAPRNAVQRPYCAPKPYVKSRGDNYPTWSQPLPPRGDVR
jgi:hypothetical protein